MNKSHNKNVMWKRASGHVLLALVLLFVLMCAVLGTDVYAEDQSSGDFTYTVDYGVTTITGYTGTDKVVTIPATIDGHDVDYIGLGAFLNCTDLEKVIISGGKQISSSAFKGRINLTEVVLPDSMLYFGDKAFSGCINLRKINIPDNVCYISTCAFENCTSLTEFDMPDALKYLYSRAFSGCSALEKVTFTTLNDVTFGEDVFKDCGKLTLYCYKGTNIEEYAENNNIPDNVLFDYSVNDDGTVNIDGYNGKSVEVVIPDNIDGKQVVGIGDNAFDRNDKITSITMPDTIKTIGEYAFYYCTELKKLDFSEELTEIGQYAFYCCKALESVELPDKLESIGAYAFRGCSGIKEFVIPDKVTCISDGMLYGCESLTDITIPEGVTSVEGYAFYGCKGLSSINLPKSLKEIGYGVFEGCTKLKSLSIPKGISYLSGWELAGSSVEYIEFPSSYHNFNINLSLCESLKEITLNGYIERASASCDVPRSIVINGYKSTALYEWAQKNNYTYNILGTLEYENTKRVADKSGSLEVSKPTVWQIQIMENNVTQGEAEYVIEPSTTAPYAAGQLTDDYINTGVTYLNYVRYIAGLPEVYADAELNESAQYGTTLLAIRKKGLSHTPEQPEGVPDDFYKKGYEATSTSNLSLGYDYLYAAVHGCMDDLGSLTNLTTAGHRRWLLSPGMKYVGFGKTGGYYATKVFNRSADAFDYDFISWPASGNFPVDMISKKASWTVSLNPVKYMRPKSGEVKVKVTRHSDNKVWDMVATDTPTTEEELANTDCFVNNVGYGVPNCILFYLDGNDCAGTYTVEITGLQDLYESEVSLKYDINFYDKEQLGTIPTISDISLFTLENTREHIVTGIVANTSAQTNVEYRWSVRDSSGAERVVKDWTLNDEWLDFRPGAFGEYTLIGEARAAENPSSSKKIEEVVYFNPYIKGKCQLPYDMVAPGEPGYLIGVEAYENPNQSYQYEMLILDCTLLAQGQPAWVYTTNKFTVTEGAAGWCVWQPQYGYYWTLFRVYDAEGNMIDEACYPFVNAY